MNIKIKSTASGKLNWLEVRDKNGNLKTRVENVPNIILNAGVSPGAFSGLHNSFTTYASNAESWEDMPGTWSQTGNTITRATGAGTFPSSPSHVGNELYWYDAGANTGHRVHVTARASDTSITVSGPARSITGGKLRRFLVNGGAFFGSSVQSSNVNTELSNVQSDVDSTHIIKRRISFPSASSAYSLGSIMCAAFCRVKLPAPIAIDAEDQIQCEYEFTETILNRHQVYELGAESVGIPQKHSMLSIVGNGTYVDVTFSAATHFLAGDKLDLRGVITKKVAISSASSTSTTFTINTATAHSLNPGDSVTIEGASVGPYNGVFTVATTPTGTQFTITDAANPGAMGAAGTARLTNPSGYFDDLGLATIASMQSGGTVARITSTIIGPAVEPVAIGGDPGIDVRIRRYSSASTWQVGTWQAGTGSGPGATGYILEANAQAPIDITTTGGWGGAISIAWDTVTTFQSPGFGNDFTHIIQLTRNAGTGTSSNRIKQFRCAGGNNHIACYQITLNTPFNKTEAHRLRMNLSMQAQRTLDLTGL